MSTQVENFITRNITAGRSLREIGETFLRFGSEMFVVLGCRPDATRIETFHDLGVLRPNMSQTGFFSLRNADLFYWVLLKGSHQSFGDETLKLEFEAQMARSEFPILQVEASRTFSGDGALGMSEEPIETVRVSVVEQFSAQADELLTELEKTFEQSLVSYESD